MSEPKAATADVIRSEPHPSCTVCGSTGELLHQGLDDALFGAPGKWSMRRCSNPRCGLVWLDPRPLEEEIGKAYRQYYTHESAATAPSLPKRIYRQVRSSYLRSRLGYRNATSFGGWRWLAPLAVLHPAGGDAFAAMTMFLPAPGPASSLLDVGCGAGDFLAVMRDLGWHVTGLETDPAAVERARSRGFEVHQGRLEDAHFPDAAFDAVTMAHVIEHVHDPRGVLDECRRILRPGGKLVILTPNNESWGHRHFGRDWRGLEPPRHIQIFNASSITTLIQSAGLAPQRVATLAINASAVWNASVAIRRRRAAAATRGRRANLAIGVARQFAERLHLVANRSAGEDLLAVATKGR